MQLAYFMTKNKNIFVRTFITLCSVFVLLFSAGSFTSCGSTKGIEEAPLGTVEDFTKRYLTNGIPVVYKQNRGSKIVVFRMVFEGGTSALDASMGGLEDLTLDLVLRGSEKYSYDTISQLEYEKSFSFTSSSGKDYATAGFVCIQRDLSEVLAIFSDCMMNPTLSEADYNQKMTEASSAIASKKSDPSGALSLALSKTAFEGHPYATTSSITEESYKNLNLNLAKGLYQSLINALRIKFVVVGNFSADLINDFTASLEQNFGNIPRKAFSIPKIPKIPVNTKAVRVANEQAGNTGYVAGFFECPNRSDDDYIPFAIATMYLDELFFSQVREKSGAVYSINTGVIGGKEMVGVISVYKASEKKQLKKLILDAILSFDGNHLDKYMAQYKNKYITSLFSSSQTASGVANSIVSSMNYLHSESAYLERADLIQQVATKDVIAAFKKYIEPVAKQDAACWVIVDGEENLDDYDF